MIAGKILPVGPASPTLWQVGERAMRRHSEVLLALIAALMLLLPNSASVLCVAPGHVAVEDINAGCCSSSSLSRIHNMVEDELTAAECGDRCTDLYLSSSRPGTLLESQQSLPDTLSFESETYILPSALLLSGVQSSIESPADPPASPSVPLRC